MQRLLSFGQAQGLASMWTVMLKDVSSCWKNGARSYLWISERHQWQDQAGDQEGESGEGPGLQQLEPLQRWEVKDSKWLHLGHKVDDWQSHEMRLMYFEKM